MNITIEMEMEMNMKIETKPEMETNMNKYIHLYNDGGYLILEVNSWLSIP